MTRPRSHRRLASLLAAGATSVLAAAAPQDLYAVGRGAGGVAFSVDVEQGTMQLLSSHPAVDYYGASRSADGEFLVCDGYNSLFLLDAASGNLTILGSTPVLFGEIAQDPVSGTIYCAHYTGYLLEMDPVTYGWTFLGQLTGVASTRLLGLAWDSVGGRLLGLDQDLRLVLEIDPRTLQAAPIASIPALGPTFVSDLWIDPVSGRTFLAEGGFSAAENGVWEMDLATGSTWLIARPPATAPARIFGLGGGPGLRDAVGQRYCSPAVPNASGLSGRLEVAGSPSVAAPGLALGAHDLPVSATVMFIASLQAGSIGQPGGSVGVLCLDGPIGRFNRPGQIVTADRFGQARLPVDLARLPHPALGVVAGLPDETWRFQAWYRDTAGGVATSNFTDAVAVTLTP